MALALQSQWTLVAAGLMAHADRVLAGEECERLMLLVEQGTGDDEYARWLAAVSDPARLAEIAEALPAPPADSRRAILEEAWLMAVVDGERVQAETAMLETLGQRFSIEPVQLEYWREAWTSAQHDRAEATARLLGVALGDGAPVLPEHRRLVETLALSLPTTAEHREALARIAAAPIDEADVVRRLGALSRPGRRDAAARALAVLADQEDLAGARARIRAVAVASGIAESEIEHAER